MFRGILRLSKERNKNDFIVYSTAFSFIQNISDGSDTVRNMARLLIVRLVGWLVIPSFSISRKPVALNIRRHNESENSTEQRTQAATQAIGPRLLIISIHQTTVGAIMLF